MVASARELWNYRELVYFLAWRDVRVRYKQAAFGVAWAVLRPLLLVAIFTFLFSKVGHVDTHGIPYPIFAYVGMLLWTYFSTALQNGAESLVGSSNLVTKTYFPRLALPLAAVIAQLPDLAVGLFLLIPFMLFSGVSPSAQLALLPVLLVLLVIATAAVSIWLAALNVKYRDVKVAVPFLIITPALYPASAVPHSMQAIYGINPMAGLIELTRWSLLNTHPPGASLLLPSAVVTAALLVLGLRFFRHAEATFADVI
jgi:lipopolysaccharide transport system permease protein